MHLCSSCFQHGHTKSFCPGFDWGSIKINGFPMSLFMDPQYRNELAHFKMIKVYQHNSVHVMEANQLQFFKIHASSWFTLCEFLGIYGCMYLSMYIFPLVAKVDRQPGGAGFSIKEESEIEKIAIQLIFEPLHKPVRRYYGTVTWNIGHIPILENAVQQFLRQGNIIHKICSM